MPVRSITPQIASLIGSLATPGTSARSIAKTLKEGHGIALDQRTISRHLGKLKGKKQARKGKPGATKTKGRRSASKGIPKASTQVATPEVLEEVETLKAQAKRLHGWMNQAVFASDFVRLNAELRQTFAQLRRIEQAALTQQQMANDDLSEVMKTLRDLAANETQDATEEAPEEDSPDVDLPEASGTARIA